MPAIKYYAIIVGGGSGSRMQSDVPKQFLLLNGRPVLMHTIEAFYSSQLNPEIIVVLNVDYHSFWENQCREHNFEIPHQLVKGGPQRFHSVKNALIYIAGSSIVAIHDAVRPLVSHKLIDSAFRQAEGLGNAVAAVKSSDSIRQGNLRDSVIMDRENIYLVQTPQAFKSEILLKAYRQDYRNEFTDDASVAERSGVQIMLIEGDRSNLKITFPGDLLVAGMFLNDKN
ncbi:MAG: 2-C-methyl-D-erythritol 4-phosphate cytidylyltransferase [Daejeonella sp.]